MDQLTKYYGDLLAVDHISFAVEEEELFGFLAPNGAGKTTTVRMLSGLTRMGEGEARGGGFDVRRQAKEVKAHIGVVQDTSNFPPHHPLHRGGGQALRPLAIISEGKILLVDAPEGIKGRAQGEQVVRVSFEGAGEGLADQLRGLPHVESLWAVGDGFEFRAEKVSEVLLAIADFARSKGLRIRSSTYSP